MSLISEALVQDPSSSTTHTESSSSEQSKQLSPHLTGKSIVAFTFILFLFIVLKNGWLSDDSYITLRTVDNAVNGYGLTWNTDERVQVYTHPLWMMLLTLVDLFVRHIYFTAMGLGLLVSALAVGIFAFKLAKNTVAAVVGLAALTASKSFIDFSTSGLENPLTHLLIVLFVLVYFSSTQKKRYVFWLSLLSCFMILNRMDTILLFIPTLAVVLWQQRSLKTLKTMVLCFIPFIVWELFSLLYYGFLFPNTAYAKLNTGIPSSALLQQGIAYVIGSFTFDPILLIILLAAFALVFLAKDWKSLPLVAGMLLYMAYTVKVGGDFMAGRFFTPSYLFAVILLVRNLPTASKPYWITVLTTIAILGLWVPNSRIYVFNVNPTLIDSRGIADEHLFYEHATGLVDYNRGLIPNSDLALTGLKAKESNQKVILGTAIGYLGYEASPHVHIIDEYALADALLARLPVTGGTWRIGHFQRTIPAGYVETVKSGQDHFADKNLGRYYETLHTVISGPIFSWQRFVDIWELNTGQLNYLLHS